MKIGSSGLCAALLFRLLLAPFNASAQGAHPLTSVYKNPDFQVTGVSVSKTGRVFVNFPRWSDMYQNAVMEVMPDGSAKPFPNDEWNKWDLQIPSAPKHFVCVQSVVVDHEDNLWVLDPAAPMLLATIPGGPEDGEDRSQDQHGRLE